MARWIGARERSLKSGVRFQRGIERGKREPASAALRRSKSGKRKWAEAEAETEEEEDSSSWHPAFVFGEDGGDAGQRVQLGGVLDVAGLRRDLDEAKALAILVKIRDLFDGGELHVVGQWGGSLNAAFRGSREANSRRCG